MCLRCLLCLLHDVWIAVLKLLGLVVPVNLELCYARLFSKDVTSQAGDVNLLRRVLVHLGIVIFDVAVIADS